MEQELVHIAESSVSPAHLGRWDLEIEGKKMGSLLISFSVYNWTNSCDVFLVRHAELMHHEPENMLGGHLGFTEP